MKKSLVMLGLVASCVAMGPASGADWVIGNVSPTTGPLAASGNDLRAGAQLAFNTINNKGGVSGRKLRFVAEDNADQSALSVSKARELIAKEHPIAFLATGDSVGSEALVREKVFAQAGIPLVGAKTGALAAAQSGQSEIFLTRATYADELAAILKHCSVSGMKKIAFIYQNDSFGKDVLAAAQKLAGPAGVEIVVTASYEPAAESVIQPVQTDKAVKAVLAVPHQAVIFAATTPATADFVQVYNPARGAFGVRFALSSSEAPLVVQRAGIAPSRGLVIAQVVPSVRNESKPIIRKLIADLRAGGAEIEDVNPSPSFVEGYIAAQVLIEGLRRAGPAADAAKLTQALQGLRNFDLGGYAISFDSSSRSGSNFVELAVISSTGEAIR